MICLKLIRTLNRQSLFKLPNLRFISHNPHKFLEVEDRWRNKDGVSKRWNLIYKAPMEKILNFVSTYLTFTTTSLVCTSIYYAAFIFDVSTMNEPLIVGNDLIIANNAMESSIYLGSFIVFNLAVKLVLSKFVIRLYKDGDNYTAIYGGHWYNHTKKHLFHLDEFVKLNPTFVVTWGDARYGLGKRHGILLPNYFKTPEYLNYLLYKRKSNNSNEDEDE